MVSVQEGEEAVDKGREGGVLSAQEKWKWNKSGVFKEEVGIVGAVGRQDGRGQVAPSCRWAVEHFLFFQQSFIAWLVWVILASVRVIVFLSFSWLPCVCHWSLSLFFMWSFKTWFPSFFCVGSYFNVFKWALFVPWHNTLL